MTWQIDYNADQDAGTIRYNKPDGGVGPELNIQFQHGPIKENGINGVQNEQILELLEQRLRALDLRFPCEENKWAIASVNTALKWLQRRTRLRVEQGVEGLNRPHSSSEVLLNGDGTEKADVITG